MEWFLFDRAQRTRLKAAFVAILFVVRSGSVCNKIGDGGEVREDKRTKVAKVRGDKGRINNRD